MPRLDSIPYDIFYQIVLSLDCTDFNNLSQVNQTINNLMSNESISKKSVNVRNQSNHGHLWEADNVRQYNIAHTKEATLANLGKITYREALRRFFTLNEAVATANPYFAAVLSYGNAFIYNQGFLCYIHSDEIRIFNVHVVPIHIGKYTFVYFVLCIASCFVSS